ncbi:zinc finger protein 271-like [Physella acuta]|uniref:zinc finger protein 271-like n=1 Tax=Physella acuta TaxID=109671 RepID=UPI0027DBF568|nr:zinc finger protein 271-like [Physella acuta]
MEEYSNLKPQFKNESLAMTSLPVFPPRSLPGTFQNPGMASHYGFNMDMLGHTASIYNHPPPTHHPAANKMTSHPQEADQRHINHSFGPKVVAPPMSYHNFAPLTSCNIITTNGFYNNNTSAELPKHPFDEVLNSPANFNDPSLNPQMMSKVQYHQPPGSIMAELNHYSHEPVNSYIQTLNSTLQNENSMTEQKKRPRSQKVLSKPLAPDLQMNVDMNQINHCNVLNGGNNISTNNTNNNNNVVNNVVSEFKESQDISGVCNSKTAFKCGFCDLKFYSNDLLLGHLISHTNCLPYRCGVCNTGFIEGSYLLRHVQLAHNLKHPYECGLCTLTFPQNDLFLEHVKSHESQQNMDVGGSRNKLPPFVKEVQEKPDKNTKEEETEVEDDDDEEENSGDNSCNGCKSSSNSTVLIGMETNLSLRKGPSKIVMDDVDLNEVCTIIVEPSSAGGIRKKHLFKCNFCAKICKDKGSLVSHVRTHTKGRPYECNMCYAKFKQYAHLSDHIMTKHTKERPFVCDRCAKTFNRKSHLQDHIRLRHTEDKLYHCPECSLTFQKRAEFSDHKRTHGKPPKYQCNMCSRQFRNVTDYERHIRSHTKEKRFECEVCHLTFGLLANAKKHMIKHSEERPFKCDVCPKAYHFEHDYKRHKLTHLNKKPFPCSECYKSFKTAVLLKKHAKETHMQSEDDPETKPFKCQTCRKRFKIQWDLDRHRKIHARKKAFLCLYCYKSYGSEQMLAKHAKIHEGQNLPLYDHSQDIIDESETEEKPKKRGRKSKRFNNSESTEIEESEKEEKPVKRCRSSRKGVKSTSYSVSVSKIRRRGRPAKPKPDSGSEEERTPPRIKITFRQKKFHPSKFTCENCNKVFLSKALLQRHSLTHMEEDTEVEEQSSANEDSKPSAGVVESSLENTVDNNDKSETTSDQITENTDSVKSIKIDGFSAHFNQISQMTSGV